MKLTINWQTLASVAVSFVLSGQLAAIVPPKYRAVAQALPTLVAALFPQLVTQSTSGAGTEGGKNA